MKVFPKTIWLHNGAAVTLYADGTCQGDPALVELYLGGIEKLDVLEPGLLTAMVLWLTLRAMQDERRIGRAPR